MRRSPVPPLALAGALALLLASAPAPAVAQQPCGGNYTVRSGDTLGEIANRCGTTIPALLATNPGIRNDSDLEVGGQLRMPPPGLEPSAVEACGGFYTLRSGDTVEDVAERCGLTVPLIIAANPALAYEENVVVGGQVRIPEVPTAAATIGPPVVVGWTGAPASAGVVAREPSEADDAGPENQPAPETPELLRHQGVLVRGDRCMILRTDDGTEIGIAGELDDQFQPGQRLVASGLPADADCGTETTIEPRILWRPRN